MKNKMGVKNVTKKIFFVFFVGFISIAYCQKPKYLLFKSTKDSIVTIGEIKYYKIDKNLFDINRFNQVDIICKNKKLKIKDTTVKELWSEGKKIFMKTSEEKNLVLESYNQIFEEIYVLEKISDKKYKRTRVWWIDY
tara:strand:+ start:1216 stop:1626 length:411 start_codon:yes stop_codon:yes gene_type:complete